jgi:predicted GNAT superfamily acetyltransferase
MNPDIVVRPLITPTEHERAYDLQAEVWSASTAVPTHLTIALQRHGGVVLGAFGPNDDLLGFVFGFTGFTHIAGAWGGLSHHSHVAAVRPEFRGRGIGETLKRAQREAVLAQGINLMTWTFDPLEARNAHFNVHKLGAIARTFVADCYGPMNDALNAGLPSDRFEVEWWLDRRMENGEWRMASDRLCLPDPDAESPALHPHFSIDIPRDFQAVKRDDIDVAWRWRIGTRARFERAFTDGYVVADFRFDDERAAYVLARPATC